MWKEFWILTKMLFTKVEPNLKALPIVKMKHFPFRGYSAMQWCGHIIDREDDNVEISEEIMYHEMIHYKQACTLGSWFRYYIVYLWEYLKFGYITWACYYCHPMEIEAHLNDDNPDYQTYKGKYKKYKMKHIRRRFREHYPQWKEFFEEYFKDINVTTKIYSSNESEFNNGSERLERSRDNGCKR
jgi:hypothetical protein